MVEYLSHDTGIWVLFSFLIFAFVAYKLGKDSVLSKLDGRIEEIRKEIETAETLRVEAQELLAQYQRKQRDAEKEASELVKQAEKSAVAIREKAEADHAASMQRREQQLAERIKRIQDNAVAEIQNHAADVAITATKEIISQTLDEKTNAQLVDNCTKQSVKNSLQNMH